MFPSQQRRYYQPAWRPYRTPRQRDWLLLPRHAGKAFRWAAKAPAERMTLPAGGVIWADGALLHALAVPWGGVALTGSLAVPALTYAVVSQRTHRKAKDHDAAAWRSGRAALGMMLAGSWSALAARWGILAGPDAAMSLTYWGLALGAYAFVRHDDLVKAGRDWRGEKTRWHQVSGQYGLAGSHLLSVEKTRLGRALEVDTRGTGRRASQLATRDTAERIAEHRQLPASRVLVQPSRIAGRIRISIRERDPWEKPVPHPVLDAEPELTLPEHQSVLDPMIVGQDPETGKPLEVVLYDEDGANGVFIIGITGAGKTVLLNCLMERLSACDDVLVWDINLSKARENRRWAPACDLTAHGGSERRRAVDILRLAVKVIEYRGMSGTDAVHVPSAADPAIVLRVDEMDELQGGTDFLSLQARTALAKINSKKRSEGIVLIEAGQRGTQTHAGSADIRANFNTFCLGMVRSATEAMHAAGELGLELPNMATYGDGHAGVWAIAALGSPHQAGRTFHLKHLGDLSRIAADRKPRATLPPGLREYLGDAYERLKTRQATAHVPSGDAPQPWMDELAKELGDVSSDIFDQMDRVADMNRRTRSQLDELESRELPEVPPEHAGTLRRAIETRRQQAAMSVTIPDDRRRKILTLARDGAASKDLQRLFGVSRQTVYAYLYRLSAEGLVVVRGRGAGARWHLADPAPPAPGN